MTATCQSSQLKKPCLTFWRRASRTITTCDHRLATVPIAPFIYTPSRSSCYCYFFIKDDHVPYTFLCKASGNVDTTLSHGCSTTKSSFALTASKLSMLLYRKHSVHSSPSTTSTTVSSYDRRSRLSFFPRTCFSGKMRHRLGNALSRSNTTNAPNDACHEATAKHEKLHFVTAC